MCVALSDFDQVYCTDIAVFRFMIGQVTWYVFKCVLMRCVLSPPFHSLTPLSYITCYCLSTLLLSGRHRQQTTAPYFVSQMSFWAKTERPGVTSLLPRLFLLSFIRPVHARLRPYAHLLLIHVYPFLTLPSICHLPCQLSLLWFILPSPPFAH